MISRTVARHKVIAVTVQRIGLGVFPHSRARDVFVRVEDQRHTIRGRRSEMATHLSGMEYPRK